jgi:hypothetical protein
MELPTLNNSNCCDQFDDGPLCHRTKHVVVVYPNLLFASSYHHASFVFGMLVLSFLNPQIHLIEIGLWPQNNFIECWKPFFLDCFPLRNISQVSYILGSLGMPKALSLFVNLCNALKLRWPKMWCQKIVLVMVRLDDALRFSKMMFTSKFR